MSSLTQHGYLLLADISGYTSFVAGTELEHSHEILSDLLQTICDRIQSLLTIHKLEGDAVFAYAPESKITRGETLLELIESIYAGFRDRQTDIRRATTCTCNACRNIPSLDLKFITHHGDYILQSVGTITEMVGSDVNLVHRLLKNHVGDATGWKAYALFTEKSLQHLGVELEKTFAQAEAYEHLGEVNTRSIDMRARYQEILAARRVVISKDEADVVIETDFPTPPPLTWEWLNDPVRRNQWSGGPVWSKGIRPQGRTGSGARNHCAHGKTVSTEVVLDWRPFDYVTVEMHEHEKLRTTETDTFEALGDQGTRVISRVSVNLPLPKWLRRPIARYVMLKMYKYDAALQEAARLAGAEAAQSMQDV
ncbi:MAG TPA: DUF2652 domain-containing protein [Anaerolineales bacterium]